MKRITTRHKRFVEEYCACFNGAQAAREAGYAESRARVTASELLSDPDIQEMVEERLKELAMSAAEATKRMADIARSDFAEFYTIVEDDEGEKHAVLDLVRLIEEGPSHLIKEIKYTKFGPTLKSYDAQKALKTILKAHGELGAKGTEDDPVHTKHEFDGVIFTPPGGADE